MACSSMKACCTGVSAGGFDNLCWRAHHAGSPSSVVTALFPTAERGVTHDRVSTPSISTEQEPHCARPHPNLGPFNSNSPESTYSNGVSAALFTVHRRSFTRICTLLATWSILERFLIATRPHAYR